MKGVIKKIIIFTLAFAILALNIFVIADSTKTIVNLGATLRFSTEKAEVLTGEVHKVTVKSAYADPNDSQRAVYRLYLRDKDGNPNENVEILNMENDKITYEDINSLGDVEVVLKEDKDDSGIVKEKYLEYTLNSGMTVFMEIEFFVPNGKIREEKLIISGAISYEDITDSGNVEEKSTTTENTGKPILSAMDIDLPEDETILSSGESEQTDNNQIVSGNEILYDNQVKDDTEILDDNQENKDSEISDDNKENNDNETLDDNQENKDSEISDDNQENKDSEISDDNQENKDSEISDDNQENNDNETLDDNQENKDNETIDDNQVNIDNEVIDDNQINNDNEIIDNEQADNDNESSDNEKQNDEVANDIDAKNEEEQTNEATEEKMLETEEKNENIIVSVINKFLGSIAMAISNEKIDEDIELTWKGEFKYDLLTIRPSSQLIQLHLNEIATDIACEYSLKSNNGQNGSIFAKKINATLMLDFHDIVTFTENSFYDGNGHVYLDDNKILLDINIQEYQDYTLNVEILEQNRIKIELTVNNNDIENNDIFNIINALTINIHMADIEIPADLLKVVKTQSVDQEMSVIIESYDGETKQVDDRASVGIDNTSSGITIKKNIGGINTSGSSDGSGLIYYIVTIINDSNKEYTEPFKDELSNLLSLSDSEIEKLENQGFTVSYVDDYYTITKNITISAKSKIEIEYIATILPGVAEDEVILNTASFYDATKTHSISKKGCGNTENISISKEVTGRYDNYRYYNDIEAQFASKITSGKELFIVDDGDLIEYTVTIENSGDFDVFVPYFYDYCNTKGPQIGDSKYGCILDSYIKDLKIDTSNYYSEISDNSLEYRNHSNGSSYGAPIMYINLTIPAKSKIRQTMCFLVARDTEIVSNYTDSFALLQYFMSIGQTPDEEGYLPFISTSTLGDMNASTTQKIMNISSYRDKHLKLRIEREKRYPNFLLGKREVITKDNPEIKYVSIGDIIEYTLIIENTGEELIDYTANFGSNYVGYLHPVAKSFNTAFAPYSQLNLGQYGITTNEYNQLEQYMSSDVYNSYSIFIKDAKIKGNSTYKQTIVEIVGTTNSNGSPISYNSFYSTMFNELGSATFGEAFKNDYKMFTPINANIDPPETKEVRVKSYDNIKSGLIHDLKIIGRYPNYLNDEMAEKIESGDLLKCFTAGDRLECLITITNDTPIVVSGAYLLNMPRSINISVASGDEYNDIMNDTQVLYDSGTFGNFTMKAFKTYKQKVYIDIPTNTDQYYNDGENCWLNGTHVGTGFSEVRNTINLKYSKSPLISISTGVYMKSQYDSTSTNIEDYRNLNLNYYTDDDNKVIYYAYIFNNSDVPMNLYEYDFIIDHSKNQTFEGLCTIDEMSKVPRLIENGEASGIVQAIQPFPIGGTTDEITYYLRDGNYSYEKVVNMGGVLKPGHGFYILYSLAKNQGTDEVLESTVSISKRFDNTNRELMLDKSNIAYPYYIDNASDLYTIDDLNHETTTNFANYEKTQSSYDTLDYVTTPTSKNLLMWSGVYLKRFIPYKVNKSIYDSGDAFGSGENKDSICFEINVINNSTDSGDRRAIVYDVLRVDTSNFVEGKNITDYYNIEPESNNGKYLLNKNIDGTYSLGSLARVLTDDTEVENITVKFYSGDLFDENGNFDYEKARSEDNWVDEIHYINTPETYENRVVMKFEIPNTFKQKAAFRYKLFLKDEAENVDGILRGINKAYTETLYEDNCFDKDTDAIPFIFTNDKINKNIKVTNIVLDDNNEASQEYADVEFAYKVYKANNHAYYSNVVDSIDLSQFEYLFEFSLKSEEEKKLVDAFRENNVLYEKGAYYLVLQEEKKFFDTTVSCTYVSGDSESKANSGNYRVVWLSISDVNTIDYVNRYNSLFDGSKRDVVITKKLGYYYSGDIVSEPLPAGSEIQFNMLDDENNTLQFVDLEVSDENGTHYKIAEQSDANVTDLLSTSNGKIYIEGLYKYINYKLVELNVPSDYTPKEDTLNVIIPSGDGAYNTDVINVSNYNNDTHIYKVDMDGNLITSDSASFTVRKNGILLYFMPLGQIDGVNAYEMVGDTQIDGSVSEIETRNGEIRLFKMPNGTYTLYEEKVPEGYFKSVSTPKLSVIKNTIRSSVNVVNPRAVGFQIVKYKSYYAGQYNIETDEIIEEGTAKFTLRQGSVYSYFTKLNIQDESGEHYRLAVASDTERTQELETYKGKIYIEGLDESAKYIIRETESPEGYSSASPITVDIRDRIYKCYNSIQRNAQTYISKTDYKDFVITSGVAKFEVTNESGDKFYFKRWENERNCSLYELIGTEYLDGSVCELETYKGQIHLINIEENTTICVKELEAPQGYVKSDTIIKQEITPYYYSFYLKLKNGFPYSDFQIKKTDTNNNLISSNSTIFEIYTASGDIVHFNDLESGDKNGRKYSYSTSGNTRLCTFNGYVYIKDMPIGNYKIKEVVAPDDYSLIEDEVPFELTTQSYVNPPIITVQDPSYVFGSEGYVSLSFQKIMERANEENYGYGFAKTTDTNNYISVLSKEDIVNYTLRLANNSKKTFNKIVLINKLANVDDKGVVNLNSDRESDFRIKLLDNPNFEIRLYDEQGRYTVVNPNLYRVDYSDETEYTEEDWNGEESESWSNESGQSTEAFRITFLNEFELPSTYSIGVLFDGEISEEAEPGEIGWNSFGYRYYVDDVDLTAEPPKVGVMIAKAPTLTKEVVYNEKDTEAQTDADKTFEFEIYEKGNKTPIKVISVKNGETIDLELKKKSQDEGFLELGKTYIIKEKEVEGYSIKDITINNGEAYDDNVEFELNPRNVIEIKFVNEKDYKEEPVEPEEPEKPNKPGNNSGGSTKRKTSKDVEVIITDNPEIVSNTETVTNTENNEQTENTSNQKVPEEIEHHDYIPDISEIADNISEGGKNLETTTEELPKTGDNIISYVVLLFAIISLGIVIKTKTR